MLIKVKYYERMVLVLARVSHSRNFQKTWTPNHLKIAWYSGYYYGHTFIGFNVVKSFLLCLDNEILNIEYFWILYLSGSVLFRITPYFNTYAEIRTLCVFVYVHVFLYACVINNLLSVEIRVVQLRYIFFLQTCARADTRLHLIHIMQL